MRGLIRTNVLESLHPKSLYRFELDGGNPHGRLREIGGNAQSVTRGWRTRDQFSGIIRNANTKSVTKLGRTHIVTFLDVAMSANVEVTLALYPGTLKNAIVEVIKASGADVMKTSTTQFAVIKIRAGWVRPSGILKAWLRRWMKRVPLSMADWDTSRNWKVDIRQTQSSNDYPPPNTNRRNPVIDTLRERQEDELRQDERIATKDKDKEASKFIVDALSPPA